MERGEDLSTEFNLLGRSPAFLTAKELMRRFAHSDAAILLQGETGTGKEIAARAIHNLSPRRNLPFVPVNCGAIPDTLIESEFFGHERGAFTDAHKSRQGLIADAGDGTLFLDEIEAMTPRAQAVLLRFLQDYSYRPVGGGHTKATHLRVIAASNADLQELVRLGQFRLDLLHRLGGLSILMPPLREREGDVEILALAFLDRLSSQHRRPAARLHEESLAWMRRYSWPGNVRELEGMMLRAFLLADSPEIRVDQPQTTPPRFAPIESMGHEGRGFSAAKAEAIRRFERTYLHSLLTSTSGNMSLAARLASQDRGALNRLVRKNGIEPNDYRRQS